MRDRQAPPGSPSPLWGGARGGGNSRPQTFCNPPTLSLPHKVGARLRRDGEGNVVARSVSSIEGRRSR